MRPDHFQYLGSEATCFAHTFEIFISFNSYVAHLLDSKPYHFRWGFPVVYRKGGAILQLKASGESKPVV
jgi:hypothetical protein